VPPVHARDAVRALTVQGAAVIEIGPVGPQDVPTVLAALADHRRGRIVVSTTTAEVAKSLGGCADRVVIGPVPDHVHVSDPKISTAVTALADPAVTVLATPALLLESGPSWFQRVYVALTPTSTAPGLGDLAVDPRKWPGWLWGLLVAVGMLTAGLVAALITLGPVLLWYDRDYLGTNRAGLDAANSHLVAFLQHDRITMAGTMISIGVLYFGLAWGGIRRGWPWARTAYLLSGLVGFPTLLYFLGFGFVEPLHAAATLVLLPIFLLAVWRRPGPPRWQLQPEIAEHLRRRALVGQLLMIVTGAGLLVGGTVVSVIGLTGVFVPTDLAFLDVGTDHLHATNPHLVPFIAHDRAGFGGALISAALALTLASLWGWRQGEAWLWWTLLGAAVAGFGPVIAVHRIVGYTSFEHLAPVYLGIVLTLTALTLAHPFLCARMPPV
jgi:hypothetical protein